MGPGRVLSGAHLVSDVLGGYLLGGTWHLLVLTAHDAARARVPGERDPLASHKATQSSPTAELTGAAADLTRGRIGQQDFRSR